MHISDIELTQATGIYAPPAARDVEHIKLLNRAREGGINQQVLAVWLKPK
jgi:hypothetical protein